MAKTFEIEVEKVNGHCFCGYKVGDIITCEGLNTPNKPFCGGAYAIIFPMQTALFSGATFNFEENIYSKTKLACPDNGYVVFKLTLKNDLLEKEEIRMPIHIIKQFNKIIIKTRELKQGLGREPTDIEIVEGLGWHKSLVGNPVERVKKLKDIMQNFKPDENGLFFITPEEEIELENIDELIF